MSEVDIKHMQRCLELAVHGTGNVAPNPMVGAVLVSESCVIGEGFHRQFGCSHAEIEAIENCAQKEKIHGSTLYVNLEPCCHQGKTPPCVERILREKIKKVVIGCRDPYPEVRGQGIAYLQDHGVEVIEKVCEDEAKHLNRRFFVFHEKKRPYVILKWAQTSDAYIANKNYDSKWISSEESRKLVHQWRSEEQAILIGTNTAVYDNPRLTVRSIPNKRNPIRVLLDRKQRVPTSFHIFDESAPTLLYNEIEQYEAKTATLIKIDFGKDVLSQIVSDLHSRNVLSVMVEGGAVLLQSFIDQSLWDEARVFTAKRILNDGIHAPKLFQAKCIKNVEIAGDRLNVYIP